MNDSQVDTPRESLHAKDEKVRRSGISLPYTPGRFKVRRGVAINEDRD